jgi:hypothetical protein
MDSCTRGLGVGERVDKTASFAEAKTTRFHGGSSYPVNTLRSKLTSMELKISHSSFEIASVDAEDE